MTKTGTEVREYIIEALKNEESAREVISQQKNARKVYAQGVYDGCHLSLDQVLKYIDQEEPPTTLNPTAILAQAVYGFQGNGSSTLQLAEHIEAKLTEAGYRIVRA